MNLQLLAPAKDALKNPCLTGLITEYDWVEGIALMTIFVLFFVELMTMRYASLSDGADEDTESGPGRRYDDDVEAMHDREEGKADEGGESHIVVNVNGCGVALVPVTNANQPAASGSGEDELDHCLNEVEDKEVSSNLTAGTKSRRSDISAESYAAQLMAVFILEFGVIFHSIFVGLTLAVQSSTQFTTLYVVLVFHQTFEGLALGSRLATIPWPRSKRWTPYILAVGFAISTPVAIAIGLGVRQSYPPNSPTTLITNGVFDSISAGILIYTGLVELMAHEFIFSPYMQKAPIKVVLAACGNMCLGAGLMAALGKWT